jgi:hypothetical protein
MPRLRWVKEVRKSHRGRKGRAPGFGESQVWRGKGLTKIWKQRMEDFSRKASCKRKIQSGLEEEPPIEKERPVTDSEQRGGRDQVFLGTPWAAEIRTGRVSSMETEEKQCPTSK